MSQRLQYIILLIILINGLGVGQKYALVGDTSRFLCRSDSLEHLFKLHYINNHSIDTILELEYWYDNGRYEQEVSAFIWQSGGDTKIKAIYGCDEVKVTDIVAYPNQSVFTEFLEDSLYNTDSYLSSGWSHEFGYSFDFKSGSTRRTGYVRDSRRGENNFENESDSIKAEKRQQADQNKLVRWLNLIDDIIRHDSAVLFDNNTDHRIENTIVEADCDKLLKAATAGPSNEIKLPKKSPSSLSESLEILMAFTTEESRAWIRCLPDGSFSTYVHHSLGRYLRNRWNLWGQSRLAKYMNELGIHHPDDMSSIILDSFQRRLKGQDIDLEGQIRFYQDFWKEKD